MDKKIRVSFVCDQDDWQAFLDIAKHQFGGCASQELRKFIKKYIKKSTDNTKNETCQKPD